MDASLFTLETCEISVKVIKIGKRDITRSIFRQMQERHLIDEIDSLPTLITEQDGGEIWGWVNIPNDKDTTGRQFVFRCGRHLYRWQQKMVRSHQYDSHYGYGIPPSGYRRLEGEFQRLAEMWYLATILEKAPNFGSEFQGPYQEIRTYYFDHFGCLSVGENDFRNCDDPLADAVRNLFFHSNFADHCPADLVKAREELTRLASKRADEWVADPRHWCDKMMVHDNYASEYANQWDAIIDKLESVEQLYIAT